MSDSISPPPTKRRKLAETAASSGLQSTTSDGVTIYSWNINGISPLVQRPITHYFSATKHADGQGKSARVDTLRDVLRRYKWPTFLLLQEVKISPDDTATKKAVERAIRPDRADPAEEPSYVAHFCLPSDKYNARGFGRKVYGVCSIVRQDFSDKYIDVVREVDWDLEGRFLVCETKETARMPKLAVINVYAVNGTDNPYKDSKTGNVIGTRHDRKLEVHKLLQAECRLLENRGFAVIVAGDLNIARSTLDGHPNLRTSPFQHCLNRADFEKKFLTTASLPNDSTNASDSKTVEDGLSMLDTFRYLHPHQRCYTYYPRGVGFGASCDRVDMILISKDIKQNLMTAGMHETALDRSTSDHVPLFASLAFGSSEDSPSG